MNWRIEIKQFFANRVFACIPELNRFSEWNNQTDDPNIENTLPDLSVFFSISSAGLGLEYLLNHTTNIHDAVPVVFDIRFAFKVFTEEAQDKAYTLAKAVTDAIHGQTHPLTRGAFYKSSEIEDTNHRGMYLYQISFNAEVHELTRRDEDKIEVNANTQGITTDIDVDVR